LKLFGKYSYVDFTAKSEFILKLILDLKITAHFTLTSKFSDALTLMQTHSYCNNTGTPALYYKLFYICKSKIKGLNDTFSQIKCDKFSNN